MKKTGNEDILHGVGGTSKKQHYVPKFYLKFFADENNKFFVYDFENHALLPTKVFCESQCHKKYFYGEDGVLENQLSQKEGEWAIVCKKVIAGTKLDENDILKLKQFVMYQRQRTSQANVHSLEEREAIIRECAKIIYLRNGWKYDDMAEEFCKQRAKQEVSPAENVAIVSHMIGYIDDLAVLIVHYNTNRSLVTSDSPVITLNPFLRFQGYGYDNVGIVFLMPISPKHLLIVYDKHLFKYNSNTEYLECDDEDEVVNVNQYEFINAERMVFSLEKQNFSLVTSNVIEKREREERRNKTQSLGAEGSKRLIISQLRGTDYYFELPYFYLPREWRRIPYNCREAIPRHYEKGWSEKLALKYRVLTLANKISVNEKIREIIPSKTEIKIGCRIMENVARTYWRSLGYDV